MRHHRCDTRPISKTVSFRYSIEICNRDGVGWAEMVGWGEVRWGYPTNILGIPIHAGDNSEEINQQCEAFEIDNTRTFV